MAARNKPKGRTAYKFTKSAQDAACRAMARTGSRLEAALAAGISYSWLGSKLADDDDFRERMEQAHAEYVSTLEKEAHRRAVEGWDEDRMGAGGIMYQVRKFSDALLLHLLKKNDPEKHGDKVVVDQKTVTVSPADIGLDKLSLEERRQLLQLMDRMTEDDPESEAE